METSPEALAKRIDHTLIRPTATKDDIRRLCEEAREYNFRAVSVNLSYLPVVCELLNGTEVRIGSTIGFPMGATSIKTKVSESKEAIRLGANELDAVINIGYLKSGDLDYIRKEVVSLVEMAKSFGEITVKILIETCYLNEQEKISICEVAKEAKVDFVKTSTGLGPAGATVEDVVLLRRVLGGSVGIKASGGIRTYEHAMRMIDAGADIIGTSHGVAIMREAMMKQGQKQVH